MADILIQGMEMPRQDDVFVQICADGVAAIFKSTGEPRAVKVVELPEHGDLVERERVINLINSILEQTYDPEAVHRLKWLRDCVRTMANFALLPRQEETK